MKKPPTRLLMGSGLRSTIKRESVPVHFLGLNASISKPSPFKDGAETSPFSLDQIG
jgi:hypothetical protein